jgi:Uma2 family endonuclease
MQVKIARRKFTTKEYHRMAEAGILQPDERVELIEGDVVEMAPIRSRHAACVMRLSSLINRRAGDIALVNPQNPVFLREHSEPQPDISILRPREDFYATGHPRPDDILLVVEISDTTLEYDRGRKVPLYARANVPEVWLVDLNDARIEVYREPEIGGYRQVSVITGDQLLSPQSLPQLSVTPREILGV